MKAKTILATVTAVLCAVALALPAAAAAKVEWTKEGKALTANATIELEGWSGFSSEAGGIACPLTAASATLEPGSTGKITALEIEFPALCETEGGLAGCSVTEAETGGLPWTIHADLNHNVQVTGLFMIFELNGFLCPAEIVSINDKENVHGVLDNSQQASSVELQGTVATSLGAVMGQMEGELDITPEQTYGITAHE
ncbi:MAG TPA: hypothetical protein VFY04_11330 [Solirubrobacterales bacterium]|nr:hypothetical protein [Solirubrobacterales bacterium]